MSLQEITGGRIKHGQLYPPPGMIVTRENKAFDRKWHVVQTGPQKEIMLGREIVNMKFDYYCPTYNKKVRVNANKHRSVERPLFSGYIFVRFDSDNEEWQSMLSITGICRVLTMNQRPVPIPQYIIDSIKKSEANHKFGSVKFDTDLSPGNVVRIMEPFSFSGLFGVISNVDIEKGLVSVDIDLFGRITPLTIRSEDVVLVV